MAAVMRLLHPDSLSHTGGVLHYDWLLSRNWLRSIVVFSFLHHTSGLSQEFPALGLSGEHSLLKRYAFTTSIAQIVMKHEFQQLSLHTYGSLVVLSLL